MPAITGKSITNLSNVNCHPIEEASKSNMGILVVDHAPIKINTFENLLPFFINIAATGKAAYNGPAAADPNTNAIIIPTNLDFSPMIMVSFFTHTSSSPSRIKIGGKIENISRVLSSVI
jgi:hypothetical protein